MAKYAGSIHPDFKIDYSAPYQEQLELEEKWLEKVKEGYRKLAKGDLIGEEVRFQIADGYARYMVIKQRPLTVVHLDVGDGYQAHGPTIHGLRLGDVEAQVEADRQWKAYAEQQAREYEKLLEDHSVLHYHDGFGQFIRCEVVVAEEDRDHIKKGDKCLKETALVGKWKPHDLRSDSYRMKCIREGRVMLPNVSNIYEASTDLQKKYPDPRQMKILEPTGQLSLLG